MSPKMLLRFFKKFCKNCDNLNGQDEIIKKATSLAYRSSVQHALWKNGKHIGFKGKKAEKDFARKAGRKYLQTFLQEMLATNDDNIAFERVQKAWDDVRKIYHDNGITWYTYGNAQKWVAMSMKYYYVIAEMRKIATPSSVFINCCLPVDRIIMKHIKDDFGINGVTPSWSQCDDKQAFAEYLQEAKEKITGIGKTMLDYEVDNWEG